MITREELYQLVWKKPGTTCAAELGVSDVYLGRVCKALGVPRPPVGYWQKLRVGRAPPPPPLPSAAPEAPRAWDKAAAGRSPPTRRPRSQPVACVKPRRSTPRKAHVLVTDAEDHLRAGREDERGFLRSPKKLLPDIIASREGLTKCLRFASVLFNGLEARGHPVHIAGRHEIFIRPQMDPAEDEDATDLESGWSPLRPTVAYVHDVPVGLAIMETASTVRQRYVGNGVFIAESDYRAAEHFGPTWWVKRQLPTGRLGLVAYSPFYDLPFMRRWTEAPKASLKDDLEQILLSLEREALDLACRLECAGRYFA